MAQEATRLEAIATRVEAITTSSKKLLVCGGLCVTKPPKPSPPDNTLASVRICVISATHRSARSCTKELLPEQSETTFSVAPAWLHILVLIEI